MLMLVQHQLEEYYFSTHILKGTDLQNPQLCSFVTHATAITKITIWGSNNGLQMNLSLRESLSNELPFFNISRWIYSWNRDFKRTWKQHSNYFLFFDARSR